MELKFFIFLCVGMFKRWVKFGFDDSGSQDFGWLLGVMIYFDIVKKFRFGSVGIEIMVLVLL